MSIATKKNGNPIDFSTLTGHTGTVTVAYVALYDASTSGVLRFVGQIGTPRPVVSGDSFQFAANTITWTLAGASGGIIGDAEALAVLDAMLGSTTLGPATYYAALMSTSPTGAGGGTEFPATGTYVRIAVTNNPTNFPAATMV